VLSLKASVKLQSRFHSKAKILQDYQWLETKLGPLVPMEVVLTFNSENELPLWKKMQLVKLVERAVKQTTDVNATLSVATFAPNVPRGNLLWRISLRVAALNEIDYGDFLGNVNENVQNQLEHLNQPGVSALLTGGIPLVYKAQHQILRDLMISFLTAFLFISIILMFVLNSFRSGIVAMIPNVFPPLVVFGFMGWIGTKIEIGSVMTASVALGIAVDDTIHFLTWYRRGTTEGLSRFKSIRHAFEHCAKAMIDTSLICGLGVAPFLLGVFMPTVNFATLLIAMLFTALLGDLILLPAILAGPAGILFRSRKKKSGQVKPAVKIKRKRNRNLSEKV
jgi:predicted RND superfamily exporter protein